MITTSRRHRPEAITDSNEEMMMIPTPSTSLGRLLACAVAATLTLLVSMAWSARAHASVEDFGIRDASATISTTQAGAHPNLTTMFDLNRGLSGHSTADLKSAVIDLPPGFVGNPEAVPTCSYADFLATTISSTSCPVESQVGYVRVQISFNLLPFTFYEPMWALPGTDDTPSRLGFFAVFSPAVIDMSVRSNGDYGLTANATATSIATVNMVETTIWGVPADPANDQFRGFLPTPGTPSGPGVSSNLDEVPFLTNPSSCEPGQKVNFSVEPYQALGKIDRKSVPFPDITGCDSVAFDPVMRFNPTTSRADSSSGLDVNITADQQGLLNPGTLGPAHLKKAVVTLPEGMSLNPSAADGLNSCTEEQIGFDMNERQRIESTGGAQFTLSFDGETTPEFGSNPSAQEVEDALVALPSINPGDVRVTGPDGGPWSVEFKGAFAESTAPQLSGIFSELQRVDLYRATGGTFDLAYGGESTAVSGTGDLTNGSNEIHNVSVTSGDLTVGKAISGAGIPDRTTITDVDGSTVTISVPATADGTGVALSAGLAFDASVASVQTALESLPGLGPDKISVLKTTWGYRVVFKGPLGGGTDVDGITAIDGLTPANALVAASTVEEGGSPLQTDTTKVGGEVSFDPDVNDCPDNSKVGTAKITTPVLDDPLEGNLYVAEQDDNPFDSLLAGYMVAKGKGVIIKLAGNFERDPDTGQITATFDNNPQQPFSELKLHFKGGSRGVLATPQTCGIYEITTELTPWSGNDPVTQTSKFKINKGPDGGECLAGDPNQPGDPADLADRPFDPKMTSGVINPVAGGFSPFVFRLTRQDGDQEILSTEVTPPEGVTGKLAGIPLCSDEDAEAGTCSEDSKVGEVIAGAGAGPTPFYIQGDDAGSVYLSGPYKGAPLSLQIQVPAVAGPFDLGMVNVRAAMHVDKRTAQLHVISDPIPQILEGIPLRVKDLRIRMNREAFTIAPTNCDPMQVEAAAHGVSGGEADLSNYFQVGDCASLGFSPKLNLQYKGKGSKRRNSHPRLAANLKIPGADSVAAGEGATQTNIKKVRVVLPKGTFLDQDALSRVCTPTQWEASDCPEDSKIGNARAWSPILDEPLKGPVYLKVGPNELPDLAADLNGIVPIDLFGKIDQSKGRIRNTFQVVPDVPVERFRMNIRGGNGGLLVNSRDICGGKRALRRANVAMSAHNGARLKDKQSVVRCGKKAKRKRRR